MNLWSRGIFDALEKREPETVLFLSMLYFPLLVASERHAGLCAHDDATAVARLAQRPPDR
jgi:hypothetical protein